MSDDRLELALSKFNNSKYEESILLFKKSLALKEHWQSYLGLRLALNPLKNHWHSYQGCESVLNNMQNYQLAVDAFNKSITLKEGCLSHQGLGIALYNMEQYQPAIEAFNKSVAIKKTFESYLYLGFINSFVGIPITAQEFFLNAISCDECWDESHGAGELFIQILKLSIKEKNINLNDLLPSLFHALHEPGNETTRCFYKRIVQNFESSYFRCLIY